MAEATYSETYRHRRRIPRLPDDLVSYREASILLKKSRSTLRRLVIEGELDTIYIGGRPQILRPSINAYLRRQMDALREGMR